MSDRWLVVAALAAANVAAAALAHAQSPGREDTWAVSATVGGYVEGNRHAVSRWLEHNGYGVSDQPPCTYNVLFEKTCDPPDTYPRVTHSGVLGWEIAVRRTLSERVSAEVAIASEQSGTALGRCDDQASPRAG